MQPMPGYWRRVGQILRERIGRFLYALVIVVLVAMVLFRFKDGLGPKPGEEPQSVRLFPGFEAEPKPKESAEEAQRIRYERARELYYSGAYMGRMRDGSYVPDVVTFKRVEPDPPIPPYDPEKHGYFDGKPPWPKVDSSNYVPPPRDTPYIREATKVR